VLAEARVLPPPCDLIVGDRVGQQGRVGLGERLASRLANCSNFASRSLRAWAGSCSPRDLRAAATSGMFGSDSPRSLLMLKFSVGTVMQSSSASLPLPNNPAAVSNLVIRTAAIGNRSLIVAVGRVGRACRPPSFADDLSHLRGALDRASIATTFASLPIRPERSCGSEQGRQVDDQLGNGQVHVGRANQPASTK